MTLPIVDMPGPRPLPPRMNEFTARFWNALSDGHFLATQCGDCAQFSFPPKRQCPGCMSRAMGWRELSGQGRLYSLTRVHAAPKRFTKAAPYAVAIVDLDEGVRLVTRVLGQASPTDIDGPVELVVTRFSDGPLFAARLASA